VISIVPKIPGNERGNKRSTETVGNKQQDSNETMLKSAKTQEFELKQQLDSTPHKTSSNPTFKIPKSNHLQPRCRIRSFQEILTNEEDQKFQTNQNFEQFSTKKCREISVFPKFSAFSIFQNFVSLRTLTFEVYENSKIMQLLYFLDFQLSNSALKGKKSCLYRQGTRAA